MYLSKVKNELDSIVLKNKSITYSNYIARTLKTALKALFNRKDIIIQEADKKLGIVVMNRSHYIHLALGPDQLGDDKTYKPLSGPPLLTPIKTKLLDILKYQTWLSPYKASKLCTDLCYHMTDETVRCCRMFYYPKIHELKEGSNLPLRPLCSSPKFITYNTSKYLDISLQVILRKMPSHVRNSSDMIIGIEQTILKDFGKLGSADVLSLYPSINIIDGLNSMKWVLEYFKFDPNHIKFLVNLAQWVLINNFVCFNGHYYLQIKGVAMGTPFAVVFSCMHLFKIEIESFQIFYNNPKINKGSIKLYKRFIDDISYWADSFYSANLLMSILNSRREGIKFDFHIDDSSTDFLDITIFKGERYFKFKILDVKAFQKPLNQFLFLPPISSSYFLSSTLHL